MRNVLTDYRREAERLGATDGRSSWSAREDAENGEAFRVEIEWSYGFTTQLLGGEDGELTTEASRATGGSSADARLDIGGGSTELVVAVRTVSTRGRASTSAPSG